MTNNAAAVATAQDNESDFENLNSDEIKEIPYDKIIFSLKKLARLRANLKKINYELNKNISYELKESRNSVNNVIYLLGSLNDAIKKR